MYIVQVLGPGKIILDPTSPKFRIRIHSLRRGLPMLADGKRAIGDHELILGLLSKFF
jgi:hypothetical protein